MKTETKKTTVKKAPVKKTEDPVYNQYGVCIACQGGSSECFHTNLVDNGGIITCKNCGITIS